MGLPHSSISHNSPKFHPNEFFHVFEDTYCTFMMDMLTEIHAQDCNHDIRDEK